MKLWLEGNQRCCDRETAIELGGSEYRNPDIKIILHFDEYISIRDNDEVCHRDTLVEEKRYEGRGTSSSQKTMKG